jgi:hypothetical protein
MRELLLLEHVNARLWVYDRLPRYGYIFVRFLPRAVVDFPRLRIALQGEALQIATTFKNGWFCITAGRFVPGGLYRCSNGVDDYDSSQGLHAVVVGVYKPIVDREIGARPVKLGSP